MGRIAKVLDDEGNLIEVDVEDLRGGRIQHHSLDDDIIDRIKKIYDYLRDALDMVPLEQFEIDFMRDHNPEKEVECWEKIIKACDIALERCGEEDNIKLKGEFLDILLLMSVNTLTDEEEDYEVVKELREIYMNL